MLVYVVGNTIVEHQAIFGPQQVSLHRGPAAVTESAYKNTAAGTPLSRKIKHGDDDVCSTSK